MPAGFWQEIVKFGNYAGDILEITTYDDGTIQSFSLISLQTGAIKGDMKIEFAEDAEYIYDAVVIQEKDDEGKVKYFESDFKFYFNEKEFGFKFSDEPVALICEDKKMDCGYSKDGRICFLKIKDLTREEYEKLVQALDDRLVDIIEEE